MAQTALFVAILHTDMQSNAPSAAEDYYATNELKGTCLLPHKLSQLPSLYVQYIWQQKLGRCIAHNFFLSGTVPLAVNVKIIAFHGS